MRKKCEDPMLVWLLPRIILVLCIGFAWQNADADSTWVYAVQISAVAQVAPPQITLNWEPDMYGAISYTIYRKAKQDTSWGSPIATLDGSLSQFTDYNVAVANTYEYAIVKAATLGYTGYGYIFTGINAPLVENRGKLILLVETNATANLSSELARLQTDLIGDGWQVIYHGLSSNDTPDSAKSLIVNDYNSDPANVKTVFLFGHVPVLHSGNLNYDGHLARPMPADAYYGDIDGDWTTSPDFLPSDVELMVGRVDLWNMPGASAPIPWPSEQELLRNYLNKDHNWRHKLINVQRLALMGNRRGDENGEATAASGYRNFEPLVGPGNTMEANTADNALPDQRWIADLAVGNYLWAYGCGGGQPAAISALGTNGQYFDVWSEDVVGQDAHAVFVMLFGSWFGNWDDQDDIMRSVLVTPSFGLASCMAGRPHWFLHHMGLGETIGYGTRLSMNNSTLYQNQSNGLPRAVYIALMGDPTLRMDPVAPPSALTSTRASSSVALAWSASPDSVLGYYIYRSATPDGPFSRITSGLVTGTTFTDSTASSTAYTYMVRSIKLQTTPSGTYSNASQGIFISSPAPLILQTTQTGHSLTLSWNSQSGTIYRVLFKTNLNQTSWTDSGARINASGTSASWTDPNTLSSLQRFYRVTSP